MDIFGRNFRVSIFGESHGAQIGVTIDGAGAGIPLSAEDFAQDIARRASGARGTTPRTEKDAPNIVSGVYQGKTTGTAITVLFENGNTRSEDYQKLLIHPRPSHADWVAVQKYGGANDPRGGGHFSGRLTLPLVVAGVVAKKVVPNAQYNTSILEIGGEQDQTKWAEMIEQAMSDGDSLGGIIECRVSGVDVGLGEPFFDSVESVASHLLFSIPAVKGVEFGAGFGVAKLRGSECNDPIIAQDGTTSTNNAGGIVGGITNGNEIVVRVAIKPTPSISRPQQTLNTETGKVEELRIMGRHDACITLRAAVVVEAAMAIALAELFNTYK